MLYVRENDGAYRAIEDREVILAGEEAIRRKFALGMTVRNESDFMGYLPALLGGRTHEVFCVAFIDAGHHLLAFEEIFRGTLKETAVYPREIIKRVLELGASRIIAVHNHPSGCTTKASLADVASNAQLFAVCRMLDIELADHYIVAGTEVGSLRSQGAFKVERMQKAMIDIANGGNEHGHG
jgi:DNA repair protein RadC